jgi:group II intron reverse transcriptase/maturase
VYIPKADGRQRPLAVAALEDKIVQRATVAVLNSIYEEEFLGFSYGFRPKRGQHDALDALCVGITAKRVNFILDSDIRSFFDEVSQSWLVRVVEHRIGDPRIVRLIQKRLKAGVLEDGVVTISEKGTGQGAVISPLLANIYLHYAFDLWAHRWRQREAKGDMIIVRYADDVVVGFEHEVDARHFQDAMQERLQAFALSLHSDKTRLIEFGRHAADRRARRGFDKPETFKFLGFIFICGRSRAGKFLLKRKSRPDRMQNKLQGIKRSCDGAGMHRSPNRENGWLTSSKATLRTTLCRPTYRRSMRSATTLHVSGCARSGVEARRTSSRGSGSRSWPTTGSRNLESFTLGPSSASPSHTQGRSRMREIRSYGSVRGAAGNSRPYREHRLR